MAKARDDLRDFLAQPPSLRNLTEVGKVAALAANPKLIDGLRSAGNKGGDGDVLRVRATSVRGISSGRIKPTPMPQKPLITSERSMFSRHPAAGDRQCPSAVPR